MCVCVQQILIFHVQQKLKLVSLKCQEMANEKKERGGKERRRHGERETDTWRTEAERKYLLRPLLQTDGRRKSGGGRGRVWTCALPNYWSL